MKDQMGLGNMDIMGVEKLSKLPINVIAYLIFKL